MPNKPKNQDEAAKLLQESLASDVLRTDATTDEDVDRELREAGGDPTAIGTRGLALAEKLLEVRRLAWQDAARRKLAAHEQAGRSAKARPARTRPELLAAINTRREAFERRGMSVSAAFRKRKPEDSTDEELAEFLDELEMLDDLGKDDGSSSE